MDPAVVDCRSLIDFCRSFKRHRSNSHPSSSPHRRRGSATPTSARSSHVPHPFCRDRPTSAALDAMVLFFALAALLVLLAPYLSLALRAASAALDAARGAPVACGVGFAALASLAALWEVAVGHLHSRRRRCGNPSCRGLTKAAEFDIQLESEECVRCLPPPDPVVRPLEIGRERKELEAELKRMAPPNGRTVLIFRAPCGCPAGRMEVWGPKRLRRIKK